MSVAERPSASCSRTLCSRVERCSSSVPTSSASWRCEWCSSSAVTSRPARRSPEPGSPAAPPTCAWAQWRESRTDARLPTSGCSAARARVAPAVSGSPSQSRHSSASVATLSGVGSASCSASSGQLLTQRPQPTQLRGSSARINSSPSPFFCCSGSWKKGPVTTGRRRVTSAAVASKASSWAGRSSSDRFSCPASHVQPSWQASMSRLPASALVSCPPRRPARCLWARRRASAAGPCVPASWLAPVKRASVPSTLTPRAESGQALQQRPQPLQASGSRTGRPGAAAPGCSADAPAGTTPLLASGSTSSEEAPPCWGCTCSPQKRGRLSCVGRTFSMRRTTRGSSRSLESAAGSSRQATSRALPCSSSSASSPRRQARSASIPASSVSPTASTRSSRSRTAACHDGGIDAQVSSGASPLASSSVPAWETVASGSPSSVRVGVATSSSDTGALEPGSGKSSAAARSRASSAPGCGRVTRPRTFGPTSAASASASRRGASGGSADSRPTRPAERTVSARGPGGSVGARSGSRSPG